MAQFVASLLRSPSGWRTLKSLIKLL